MATLAALVLAALIIPRLVRRIDSTFGSIQENAAAQAALFHDMTNAYRMASEMSPDHPVARRWRECRTQLLAAGYLETRELPLQARLDAKGAAWTFQKAFYGRFPGLECTVRGAKSGQAVAIITAPKTDFGPLGAIERFVRLYQPDSGN